MKDEVKIPKIIMQTWKNETVPLKWQKSPKSIEKYMPDWEYVLMTDEMNQKFVEKYFPSFVNYYNEFPYGIQRADAIRYMWLFIHGGIYMDLDMELKNSLESLFYSDNQFYLVASGNIGSYVTNSFMASKSGAQIWIKMLNAMKEKLPRWALGKHMKVMNSTGPIMLNYVVKENSYVYGSLPASRIMPCSVCDITCQKDGAYIQPLVGSSWVEWDTTFYNFFMCNWKLIINILIVIIIVIIIYKLYRWKKH